MASLPPIPLMEKAYRRGDTSYDGVFFLGVKTTGIFCRPSCGARKPRPENVRYFATPREAIFAGFRPCLRCRPLAAVGAPPPWVNLLLKEAESNIARRITDGDIRKLGIDPARARRFFKSQYGMTFQAYCRGRRLGTALERIRTGGPLDDTLLGSGYESHSGFRDAFAKTFGLPPGKARGTDCITLGWMESPLGPLIAGETRGRIVLLEFTDRRMLEAQLRTLRIRFKLPMVPGETKPIRQLRRELSEYFAGRRRRFSVTVDAPGSEFQQRVWQELRRIPYGATVSYEALARRAGTPGGQRAAGTANGLNRIGIIIPCHRVIHKDGGLGGYGGGLWRKQALLELERGERKYDR